VTDQSKDIRNASTPTHATQDLVYCHFCHG